MKNIYHPPLQAFVLLGALIFQGSIAQTLSAQTQPTLAQRPADKPAAKPAASSSTAATTLPTEDTVNSFLFQTFGYDPTITWKIADIRPSEIPGLAEVAITITTSQGSNSNRLLVSSDGKHAISGDILPFGAKPFCDDANSFWSIAGVPAITHGPTAGGAHTLDEWVSIDDLVRVARLYALTALEFCGA